MQQFVYTPWQQAEIWNYNILKTRYCSETYAFCKMCTHIECLYMHRVCNFKDENFGICVKKIFLFLFLQDLALLHLKMKIQLREYVNYISTKSTRKWSVFVSPHSFYWVVSSLKNYCWSFRKLQEWSVPSLVVPIISIFQFSDFCQELWPLNDFYFFVQFVQSLL